MITVARLMMDSFLLIAVIIDLLIDMTVNMTERNPSLTLCNGNSIEKVYSRIAKCLKLMYKMLKHEQFSWF